MEVKKNSQFPLKKDFYLNIPFLSKYLHFELRAQLLSKIQNNYHYRQEHDTESKHSKQIKIVS